ncbi:dynein axonemal intermediate chain 3-like isoform X6 [Dreissena polymorpha]|nr:dynein axonemal intermediate chain 3-like isoform X2 [Dreissena polymorpha]XP_052258485.1 dynein axonemal intermediate chain 3-like isoform X4 [Dreissena polymorpha]XP_052258486.1 dynein axonemal intermediate chain 3-like isoform X5 [Dreissena polymorpha]XP_052258487.1 dynein axonemal intermediate chain 3-like isoform X6 [Dreissena polymorpha]
MSDTEGKEVSDKEKEHSEEKEMDTAKSPKPRKTPPSSGKSSPKKPGSAKSGTMTPKSPAGSRGRATPKSKGKREEIKMETPAPEEEEDATLPDHCEPIFLSSKTQTIFSCVCDSDVTKENRFKIIPKAAILEDLHNRAGVCDFHPIKNKIIEYPGEEFLLVYDRDFKFGQNFYICFSEETKEKLLHPPKKEGEVVEGEGGVPGEEAEDTTVYKYVPPQSKEWVSHGSEKEIKEESVVEMRRRLKVSVRRKRKLFGAPCKFTDRNVGDAKDGYVECTSYKDKTFDLQKIELDKGIQAIPWFMDSGTQTEWKYPRNANTQYYPREFSQHEQQEILKKKQTGTFMDGVCPRFQLALQQNEIMDVFFNDWLNLGEADNTFGSKADNHLKEYQSFADLQFSKEKKITDIQWHPTIKGIVAVSVAEKLTFDERIDNASKVIMTPSLILIWSFTDPINPQLFLEAPDDIHSFQFCPSNPNIIAGGCQNGQLVLWDISAHADRLKQPRGGNRNKRATVLPGFEDPNALKTPIVRYCAVSSIENSHHAPITDIMWLPDHVEINRMGVPQENKGFESCQIFTCATDNCILVWDTRPTKGPQQQQQGAKPKDKDGTKNPIGVPDTFKHLDLTWKPMLKVHLHKSEPGGDHAPTKFSIAEKQGDRGALSKATDGGVPDKEASVTGGYFQSGKPGSGREKRTLQTVKTHFFVGTEDGEVVYVDWMPQKDQDTGKIQTPKPDFYHTMHDGPIMTVQRSPFFMDILLVVGGWNFTIWKEAVVIDKNNPSSAESLKTLNVAENDALKSGPILQSAPNPIRMTSGFWSPSRPGVFYISKVDGSVDVWDLLDKTHEPSITQSVSPSAITKIYPHAVSHKQHLLAVGDSSGTLHILEIPWSLRLPAPNEVTGVANYFEREVKRRGFVVQRWDFREHEKRELEAEAKKKAGIAPNVLLTDEEIEYRLKLEYQAYMEAEGNFLRELGITKEEEPLPQT